MRIPLLAVLVLAVTAFAGCAGTDAPDTSETDTPDVTPPAALPPVVNATVDIVYNFTTSVVDAAVSFAADLYEPTMEVSDNGVIYITGHTIGADTTGAPVFMSKDDGATWTQLPFAGPATLPSPIHGATPPPSDEIFLVSGDDGWLYGVDITLATYPVNMWSGDGAELAYHNPDAYDFVQARTSPCALTSLNDRPWAAYANGTLLMVNNPGGGPVQVGVMAVPPTIPVGGPTVGPVGAQWNLCASPGGSIPGIPDIRDDGLFAVPQVQGGELIVVTGNKADIMDVEVKTVFEFNNGGTITSNYGQAVFDEDGTLFIGIANNTDADDDGTRGGTFKLASSTDGGQTFLDRTFTTSGVVQSFYMDGNMAGSGALITWAVPGETGGRSDWYVGHAFLDTEGRPVVKNVGLAVDEGPGPSAHVTGAAVGPDGRAYLAGFEGTGTGGTPLRVFVQGTGPALPVA